MAAPRENKFWKLRSRHGREKLFASPYLLWKAILEYFEWCDNHPKYLLEQRRTKADNQDGLIRIPVERPYTIQGLCRYLNCNKKYINEFEQQLKGKDDPLSQGFSDIITRARETIYQQKFEGAAIGIFPQNLISRDLNIIKKTEKNIKKEVKVLQAVDLSVLSIDELKTFREITKKIGGKGDEESFAGNRA